MAYLHKVREGKVIKVIVGDEEYLNNLVDSELGEWIISPENHGSGSNYENGVFYRPRPYPSWKLDANYKWQPPIPKTNEVWLEDKQEWVSMEYSIRYNIQKNYEKEIQYLLDLTARKHGYDNIYTASLRASIPSSAFHSEGVAFAEWMDTVWDTAYGILHEVDAGTRPTPTIAELLQELPRYTGV